MTRNIWEIIRKDGWRYDLGRMLPHPSPYRGNIAYCQKPHIQSATATGVFQFPGDYEEDGTGTAYLWHFVIKEWGLTSWISGQTSYIGNYHPSMWNSNMKDQPPMFSFMAVWDKNGVDDLARSINWKGQMKADGTIADCDSEPEHCWTLFSEPAVLVAGQDSEIGIGLQDMIDSFDYSPQSDNACVQDLGNEGILVWHASWYRASPLYFSFAKKEDILKRDMYCHFAGWGAGFKPIWKQTDETASRPVMADRVGEFSVVFNQDRTYSFEVIFNHNDGGQSGFVIREALAPWGPFDKKIPVLDCLEMDTEFRAYSEDNPSDPNRPYYLFNPGGGCYGGYSHSKLLDGNDPDYPDKVLIRFNTSLWSPYKAVLMETDLEKQ